MNYPIEYIKDIPKHNTKERSAWIDSLKIKIGCLHCGFKGHHVALHFHHVGNKLLDSSGWKQYPAEHVIQELYECVVLCANCHAIEHYNINRKRKVSNNVLSLNSELQQKGTV